MTGFYDKSNTLTMASIKRAVLRIPRAAKPPPKIITSWNHVHIRYRYVRGGWRNKWLVSERYYVPADPVMIEDRDQRVVIMHPEHYEALRPKDNAPVIDSFDTVEGGVGFFVRPYPYASVDGGLT